MPDGTAFFSSKVNMTHLTLSSAPDKRKERSSEEIASRVTTILNLALTAYAGLKELNRLCWGEKIE